MFRREVVESELDFVPRAKLKAACRRLEVNPDAGKPLGDSLSGCRSIRVQGAENRLIYRLNKVDDEIEVEILAIGRRRDKAVHKAAEKRI